MNLQLNGQTSNGRLPPETILLQRHFQWDSGELYGSQSEAVCGRIFWSPIAGRSLHPLDITGVLGRIPTGALVLNK